MNVRAWHFVPSKNFVVDYSKLSKSAYSLTAEIPTMAKTWFVCRSYNMNVANCRRLVALLVYCGAAVLVIVNGQSTTDDDIDKEEINRQLIDIVAELRAELESRRRNRV